MPSITHDSIDALNWEVEEAFQAWVAGGGLDSTHCIDEAWERQYLGSLCSHEIPKDRCSICKPKATSYWPLNNGN